MRHIGYINIEQLIEVREFKGIGTLILKEFPNLELQLVEDREDYFVIKFICEEFEEILEVVSTTSYILIEEGVYKFAVTLNYDEQFR